MTVAQALVLFLDNQYVSLDGKENKFVEGIFTIFGHGMAIGLGQALDEMPGQLKVFQGRNEQGMCHTAIGFAKQHNRRKIIACTSSVGPGATNMISGAATATVNNIPLLLFPSDTFASRQPDPVLQQIEQPHSHGITVNDAFIPVCKYFDRIIRPEQIMSAMINAMRVITDPAQTGAVCIALSQDVQGETYDFPESFFMKRVHKITRPTATEEELYEVAEIIRHSKNPMMIIGGGVKYSEAGQDIEDFCTKFKIPFTETQAGKSACRSSHPYCLGGLGLTGTMAANKIAKKADVIIAVGTRLNDFATSSKWQFQNPEVKIVSINNNSYHAGKMDAVMAVGDVKATVRALEHRLSEFKASWGEEVAQVKSAWDTEMKKLYDYSYREGFTPNIKYSDPRTVNQFVDMTGSSLTQTSAIGKIRTCIGKDDIIVTAGGSLPSCLQRMWTTDKINSYHAEYGYSCMGYEIAGALGAKLACPDNEVWAFVGDGTFQMMHSEIVTAIQEHAKINILLFDNCGYGCINNLQMSNGIGSLATEFRFRDEKGKLLGELISVDYAKVVEGYGVKGYTVTNLEELEVALKDAQKQTCSTLIDLKVIPKTMTDGYESWWNVCVIGEGGNQAVRDAGQATIEERRKARKY